jgi:hypothetical protein
MDPEDRKAFIAEYQDAQSEAKELLAYKTRFEAFGGFIEQAECVRVQKSREGSSGKFTKHYIIVKKPTQLILVVKLPLFGTPPERGDMLYWTQPKDFTDEVVLLAIKKPDGTVKPLREKFKNADGKSCPTMFFVEPELNILFARGRLNELNEYLNQNRDAFEAADVAQMLAFNIVPKSSRNWKKKTKTKSI